MTTSNQKPFITRVYNFAKRKIKAQKEAIRELSVKKFETRIEMLGIIPTGGVIAELGVFRGDFSQEILTICKPKELILIDIWAPGQTFSGDVNGENGKYYDSEDLYATVNNRYGGNSTVKIIKDWSSHIQKFPDNYFDAIYVDADHEYLGALRDLEAAYKKIKNTGWLLGHDYETNHAKTSVEWKFGVKQAVDEFCEKYNQKIAVKGMDGCVSFGIKISKPS